MTTAASFGLDDRYLVLDGEVLLSGLQAAVRAPFDQLRADHRQGLNTRAFVSGYQGSPLGTYDSELARRRALADELGLVHRPAQNEELAATAVMGSQMAAGLPSATCEGVVGIWYGKAPGLDRAADAIRHGNWAGASPFGGVLALIGDDHECKSSTLPSRSDQTIAAIGLPCLSPGNAQDVLDLAVHGIALSRWTGSWVGMKIATPIADGTSVAVVATDRVRPHLPDFEAAGRPWRHSPNFMLAPPHTAMREHEVLGVRQHAIEAYLAENELAWSTGSTRPWLSILAPGHLAAEVLAALDTMGIADELTELGIRVVRLGVVHPLNASLIRGWIAGAPTVLVVEDKQPFVEVAIRNALYGSADAPVVLGKLESHGERGTLPVAGTLSRTVLDSPLRQLLVTRIDGSRLRPTAERRSIPVIARQDEVRTPFFCAGCPHNTSLQAPEGSIVGAGIGCHGMVTFADPDRVGSVTGYTQMGGEGAQWIGASPFLADDHTFQNVGDGTYFHSAQLAVQNAVSTGTHITFKLLYNGAVAMTGGQDAVGALTVEQLAAKLTAEGVARIAITSDDPDRIRRLRLPSGVTTHDRAVIIDVQRELKATPGVTVLIHDQRCAAELRRDRKRGRAHDPSFRLIIDERICEGCGDCGVKSNCLSLVPVDTADGRKTTIDQASCNVDLSCLAGDCPAFVEVPRDIATSPRTTTRGREMPSRRDDPPFCRDDCTIRMPGIGGTGVVTVSQILAVAARLDGREASTVDQTGLSQKAGPVVSTLTIGNPHPGVDVLLAFDIVTATTPINLEPLDQRTATAIVSTTPTPTSRQLGRVANARIDIEARRTLLDSVTSAPDNRYVDAAAICTRLFGHAQHANVFLTGVAHQCGWIPVTSEAIEASIRLNGAAVDANIAAFRWGREWVVDPSGVEAAVPERSYERRLTIGELVERPDLHETVSNRVNDLIDYQNKRYADRYLAHVLRVHTATGSDALTSVVATQLHRLMAYKDEYEVARLMLLGHSARHNGHCGMTGSWKLHPPMLRSLGMRRKLSMPFWTAPAFRVLAAGRRVRGTPVDLFGHTRLRRLERSLITEYEALIDEAVELARNGEATRAASLLAAADLVRGFEDVKLANIDRYHDEVTRIRGLDAALAASSGPDR